MVTRSVRTRTALTAKQVDMFRAMLEEQRRFRVEQLSEPDDPQRPMTDADLEVRQTIVHGARLALRDVEAALQRMRDGSYGQCTQCARPMPLERLEILPHAALCMVCQSREDVQRSMPEDARL